MRVDCPEELNQITGKELLLRLQEQSLRAGDDVVLDFSATRQIMVRNLCRSLTFALGPPTMMVALLLMLILTRNRQRIGDLLGNTVVIQHSSGPEPPVAQPRNRDEDGETDA